MVTALVMSRRDFCNSLYHGLPSSQLRRLQSFQNAAARLVFNLRRRDHVTDALVNLHWLRIPERVMFKIAVLVYHAIHNSAPAYLSTLNSVSTIGRSGLRSAASSRLLIPRYRCSTLAHGRFL